MFERLAHEQRVCTEFPGDNVDGRTNFIPAMGLNKLFDSYRAIMKQIYSPLKYCHRVRRILTARKGPVATTAADWPRILAIWRASLRLGVLGKESITGGYARCIYFEQGEQESIKT